MPIRIRNKNGRLVGWDTESEEEVPLELGSVSAEELESDDAQIKRGSFSNAMVAPEYADDDDMLDKTDTAGSFGIVDGIIKWRTEDA